MTNSAKRVLIVEANEDHTVGGSHQAMFDLVRNLDRTRFEPVALFYQNNVYVDRLGGLAEVVVYEDVRRGELLTNHNGSRLSKLVQFGSAIQGRARLLRQLRIDLVHINNSPRVGNDDWLPAARFVGIPCIANAMGDAEGETGAFRRWLFRGFDHVLPISGYMHEAMVSAGIPEGRLSRVDLGVDLERVRSRVVRDREQIRRDLQLPEGKLLAVMVGNIRPWKGQHVVLDALRQMDAGLRGRLHVAFVGATGPEYVDYEGELRRTVTEHGLTDDVSFMGARHDVPDLFGAADLALHASTIPEPFGLVVVEALALGAPVIAAGPGGPAEILTQDCGVVYDPQQPQELAAALARLMRNPAALAGMREAARMRAATFTVAKYVAGVEGVYSHCTAHAGGRFRRVPPRAQLPLPGPDRRGSRPEACQPGAQRQSGVESPVTTC